MNEKCFCHIGMADGTRYKVKDADARSSIETIEENLNNTTPIVEGLQTEVENIQHDFYNVLNHGLVGDGVTDNSSALQTLINKIPEGSTIYFPNGNYLFNTSISTKDNITFKGTFKNKYNVVNETSRLFFNGCDGFVLGSGQNGSNYFEGLVIVGKENIGCAFKNLRAKMRRCSISMFLQGIYTGREAIIEDCEIFQNGIGIDGCIDSKILNNFIYNNNSNGIKLYAGCNDNIIANNKIEWNGGRGVELHQCYSNVITGNIIDRSTEQGLYLTSASQCTISNNILKRNFVSGATGVNANQLRMESCSNCSISGNILQTGNTADDGTGVVVPDTGVYLVSSNNLIFMGNNLKSGGVTTPISKYNCENATIYELNMGYDLSTSLKGTKVTGVAVANTPLQLTLPIKNITPANAIPNTDKFIVKFRKTDNSTWGAKEIIISNGRTWSDLAVKIDTTDLGTNLTMGVALNSDKDKYILSVTSTSGNYYIEVEPLSI